MSKVTFTSPTIAGVLDGWHWITLRDVVLFTQYGLSVRGRLTGKYPMLRMNNIINGKISTDTLQYVDLDDQTFARHRLVDGDILFNRTNSFELVGKCAYVENIKDSVFASYLVRVVPDSAQVDGRFLSYYLNAPETQARLKQLATRGVSQSNISAAKLKLLKIKLLPIEEQRAIAHVLRTVQQAKEATAKVIAAARQLKQSLMRHLFTYGPVSLDQADRVRLKETEAGLLPIHWHVAELREVAELTSGGTPSKDNPGFWQGPIPWASPKDIKRTRLYDSEDHISDSGLKQGSRIADAGAIFVVVRGMVLAKDVPIAMAAVPMAFNQDMKAVLPRQDQVRPSYLLYAMIHRKSALLPEIGTSAHGTRRIGTSSLEKWALPIPSMEEQERVAQMLYLVECKIDSEVKRAHALTVAFEAALKELVSGTRRIRSQPEVAV